MYFEPIATLVGLDSLVIYYHSFRNGKNLLVAEFIAVDHQELITTSKAHYSSLTDLEISAK